MKRLFAAVFTFLLAIMFSLSAFAAEMYTLTIHYQYEDGTKALDSFTGTFEQGQSFEVFTPLIEGCAPSIHNFTGEMGNTDLTYTVVFKVIAKSDIPSSSEGSSSETPLPPPEEPDKPKPPEAGSSKPIAENSIFSSWGDDFLEKEDFVAFSDETLKDSEAMMKGSIGSIVNIAAYGFIVVLAVFAVFEVIRGVAF